jgi:flagellar motor switch/type III secretory pathway protein FliN
MAAEAGTARGVQNPAGPGAGQVAPVAANPAGLVEVVSSEEDARWIPVMGLPCEFLVELPVPGFRIMDLLQLRRGSVINAHWRVGQDVPLRLNGTLLGWSEFEVMGNNLAVRMTELV